MMTMKWLYGYPTFEYNQGGVDILDSWVGHKNFAYDLVSTVKPKTIVELGTHYGTSFFSMCQAVKDRGLDVDLFAVDTWKGDHQAGYYSEEVFEKVTSRVNDYYPDLQIKLLRKTFDDAVEEFADKSINLLHIDGLHTYEAVKNDFEKWLPKVASDGVIFFHDIHTRKPDFGVHIFWEEVKKEYPTLEFHHSYGLGVLFMDSQMKDKIAPFEMIWQRYYALLDEDTRYKQASTHIGQQVQEKEGQIADLSNKVSQLEESDMRKNELVDSLNVAVEQKSKELLGISDEVKNTTAKAQFLEGEKCALITQLGEQREVFLGQCEVVQEGRVKQIGVLNQKDRLIEEKEVDLVNLTERYEGKILHKESIIADLHEKESTYVSVINEKERQFLSLNNRVSELTAAGILKDTEIARVHSSRFWMLRSIYLRSKWAILHPISFFYKYIGKHGDVFHKKCVSSIRSIFRLSQKGLKVLILHGPKVFIKRFLQYITNYKSTTIRAAVVSSYKQLNPLGDTCLTQNSAILLISKYRYLPKISIITPVYNTDPKWLHKCIESVMGQWYDNWELCLYDDASSRQDTKDCLKYWEGRDSRIKVSYGSQNLHISRAMNEGIKTATGEFISFLDHDDTLSESALYEVVSVLQESKKEIVFIYSDEDKITVSNERHDPFLKPDWSPELFLNYNYINHFTCIKSDYVRSKGAFREGFEGAQDYDLFLRVLEGLKSGQVCHIPRILYHWRQVPGSSAISVNEKPYAVEAGRRALSEYLERNHIKGRVLNKENYPGIYDVVFDFTKPLSRVSIIIPFRDRVDLLKQCLESIFNKTGYSNYELLLIDNNSEEEETKKYLLDIQKYNNIKILRYTKPFNYSEMNNFAIREASGDYICLLNNDTEVITVDWLSHMVSLLEQKGVGAVGPMLLYPDDTIQHGGVTIGMSGYSDHTFRGQHKDEDGYFSFLKCFRNVSAVTGACLLTTKKILEEVYYLDEKDFAIGFNDIDFCLKVVSAGYRVVWTPKTRLYHYESASRGIDGHKKESNPKRYFDHLVELENFRDKWKKFVFDDPYYNPWLSRHSFSGLPKRYYEGVNLFGYYNYEFGLAKNIQFFIKQLDLLRIPYTVSNVEAGSHQHYKKDKPQHFRDDYLINIVFINPDNCALLFQNYDYERFFKSKYNIAYWVYETDSLPEAFYKYAQYFDEIWTPSTFSKEILKRLNKPVTVLPVTPLGCKVDKAGSIPKVANILKDHKSNRKFLFLFDYYSCPYRKNIFQLIDIFQQVEKKEENFFLFIKIRNAPQGFLKKLRKKISKSNIKIFTQELNPEGVSTLYSYFDYYVSLHASEGYGLTVLEAIQHGIMPITTAYGGVTDFCDASNSILIDYDMVDISEESSTYFKTGSQWARPVFKKAVKAIIKLIRRRDVLKPSQDIIGRLSVDPLAQDTIKELLRVHNNLSL